MGVADHSVVAMASDSLEPGIFLKRQRHTWYLVPTGTMTLSGHRKYTTSNQNHHGAARANRRITIRWHFTYYEHLSSRSVFSPTTLASEIDNRTSSSSCVFSITCYRFHTHRRYRLSRTCAPEAWHAAHPATSQIGLRFLLQYLLLMLPRQWQPQRLRLSSD